MEYFEKYNDLRVNAPLMLSMFCFSYYILLIFLKRKIKQIPQIIMEHDNN